jgi:hypothetical protein
MRGRQHSWKPLFRLLKLVVRDVAATSVLNSQGTPLVSPTPIPPQLPTQLEAPHDAKEEHAQARVSSWSSALGLWAWDKDRGRKAAPATALPNSTPNAVGDAERKP